MMAQQTLIARKGYDADFAALTATTLSVGGNVVTNTSVLLGGSAAVDLNGEAGGIVFDTDGNTKMYASADDVITLNIGAAADFRFAANLFTALAGSVIAADTIAETTAASGVTIDGALLKDGRSNLGRQVQALTATGAITIISGLVTLAHATVIIAATLAAPTAGDSLMVVNTSASGTVAHTVTLPAGVTWNGTNNTATLDAAGEALHVIALSATRWLIIENIGSVGLSTV
jgi:hypothetical protein